MIIRILRTDCTLRNAYTVPGQVWCTPSYAQNQNSDWSDEAYNDWYNNVHLNDILASGGMKSALRYENLNKEARMSYLTLYLLLADVSFLQSKEYRDIPTRHDPSQGAAMFLTTSIL